MAPRLAAVVAAGLAGGAAAQLAEIVGTVPGLHIDETLAVTGAAGLLGVAVAAGLAVLAAPLRPLAGPRGPHGDAAPGVPLALATAVFLAAGVFAWFLGEQLAPIFLRPVTNAALPAALALAGMCGLGLRVLLGTARRRPATGGGAGPLAGLAVAALGLAALAADGPAGAGRLVGGLVAAGALAVGAIVGTLGGGRPLAATGLAALLFFGAAASAWRGPGVPPVPAVPRAAPPGSVVWIVLDTVRADHLEPYGAPAGSTPTAARLAREGTVFERVVSPSPWTVPSHASMFTGLPPRTHGAWYGRRPELPPHVPTIAERYRAAGFDAAAFYSNPWLRTAKLMRGFEPAEHSVRRPRSRLALVRALTYLGLGPPAWIDKGGQQTVAEVARWLAARPAERPFLLFVNFVEAHSPYLPPRAFRTLPAGTSQLEAIRAQRGFDPVGWHAEARGPDGRRERGVRALYAASVRYQDAVLGSLLEALAARVALDDLIVVVTADHGENLGDGGRWGHLFALNDALTRVPLLIRAPGRFPAGARVAAPFQTTDLFGTLEALSGLPDDPPEDVQRLDRPGPGHEATFAETWPAWPRLGVLGRVPASPRTREMTRPLASVSEGRFQLVVSGDDGVRLYDRSTDAEQERDVAASHPAEAAALAERLGAWREGHPARRAGEGRGPALSPEVREMLRELGYL